MEVKCVIKMSRVNKSISDHGIKLNELWTKETGKEWYSLFIPQTFRGQYELFLCSDDICGVYYGVNNYDYSFDRLMDKLGFRTPEAVAWTWRCLHELKSVGAIDFEVISWPDELRGEQKERKRP